MEIRTFDQLNDEEILQIVSFISKEFNIAVSEHGLFDLFRELLNIKKRILLKREARQVSRDDSSV